MKTFYEGNQLNAFDRIPERKNRYNETLLEIMQRNLKANKFHRNIFQDNTRRNFFTITYAQKDDFEEILLFLYNISNKILSVGRQ